MRLPFFYGQKYLIGKRHHGKIELLANFGSENTQKKFVNASEITQKGRFYQTKQGIDSREIGLHDLLSTAQQYLSKH